MINPKDSNAILVYGQTDNNARCAHYHQSNDIIAIQFYCCREFYACYDCHQALAGHCAQAWPQEEFNHGAIFCGQCKGLISIEDYLNCGASCPQCAAAFNPYCRKHWPLYFLVG